MTENLKHLDYPRVTEIISDVLGKSLPAQFYLQRGSIFHRIIHLTLNGIIDENTIDARLIPHYHQLKKFISVIKPKPKYVEKMFVHHTLKYRGTPDLFTDTGILVDFKTNSKTDVVEMQLGGYAGLLENAGEKVKKCWCVVFEDNTFEIFDYNKESCKRLFIACLTIYNWKRGL